MAKRPYSMECRDALEEKTRERIVRATVALHAEHGVSATSYAMIAKRAQGSQYEIANVYAWRGENDKAVEWLEHSYQQRTSDLVYIKHDPLLDSLRDDPRFKAILREMNFPH